MTFPFEVFFRGLSMALPLSQGGTPSQAAEGRQTQQSEESQESSKAETSHVAQTEPSPNVISIDRKKELRRMPDQDLQDDLLKTVHYEIKFKMRPYECTFGTRSETVHDTMTSTGYAGWKVAEFVTTLDQQPVPPKFRRYLDRYGTLRPQDIKHLEVWFDVVDRSTRDDLRYEEKMSAYLGAIAQGVGSFTGLALPDED
jgi:hypothetical protein